MIRPVFVALILAAGLLAGCDEGADLALRDLETTQSVRDEDKSVDQLKRDITRFQAEVDRTVKASENLGTHYRLLAVAYLNRQMYGEALDALEQAIRYYPENEQLYYYGGLAAARLAKAQVNDDAEATRLLALAEKYYLRTIYLYGDHQTAMFALAVLYSFEMNRPADAIPLLGKVLAKNTGYTEAKLVLARTHAALGNVTEAIAIYDEVARADVSDEIKAQVRENIRLLEGR